MNPLVSTEISKLRALKALAQANTLDFTLGNPLDAFPPELVPYLPEMNSYPLGYTDNQGALELRRLLAERWQAAGPEHFVITNGAQGGLALVLMALIEAGKTVVAMPNPGFLAYPSLVKLFGGQIHDYYYDVSKEKRFDLSVASLIAQIPTDCQVVIINSPGNPAPHQFSRSQLGELATWARERKIFLVLDEVYSELNYQEDYRPESYVESSDYVVSITSFSKSHGLAGIRLGSVYCKNETLIKKCIALQQNFNTCAASLSQALGIILLKKNLDVPIMKRYREAYQLRLQTFFDHTPWEHLRPQYGFYAFLPTPAGQGSQDFARQLLERHNILATPGIFFGSRGEGYIRMALSTELSAVTQLKSVLLQGV